MIERLKKYVLGHKKEIFFVFLIFLLAFGIRGQLMVYDLMFEFDSYFHARIGEFVAQTLTIPHTDPLAYYELASQGGASMPATNAFFWIFSVFIFKLFTLNAPFSKSAWIVAVKVFPALYGALICVGLYYLGKGFYGPRFGAALAFLASVMPAFAYRTMAGFFEDDSFGFLPMVLGLIFFVRAVKSAEFSRRTIIDSALAAILFAIMAWSWGVFILVPLILIAWLPFTMFMMWFRHDSGEKMGNVVKNFGIVFILMSVLATAATGPSWAETTVGYITKYLPVDAQGIKNIQSSGDSSSVYSITVGEEQQGFKFWGNKYSALILLPFIAIPLLVYRILRKKDDLVSPILLFWIAITMVMAFTKLKFTYVFGIPVAISGAVVLSEFLEFFAGKHGFEKKTIALGLGFFFLVGIASGMFFVPQNIPQIEENTGWKETVYWLQANTPKDAKLFNWWDEGHWISFIGERSVITDNRNLSLEANAAVASFMLAPTEDDAYKIVHDGYGSDYVVLSEDLLGKMNSLGLYAFGTSDPRTKDYYSVELPCSRQVDGLTNQVSYTCRSNTLTEAQYTALPDSWTDQPNQVINQTQRVFIYRSPVTGSVFIFNKLANDTFLVKLFLDTGNVTNFRQVYSNKEVRVFKVL